MVGSWNVAKTTHVDHIVDNSVLSDGDNNRLVVGGRVDRAQTVKAFRQPSGHVRRENTIDGLTVDTFEECKVLRIQRLGAFEGGDFLDDEVRMAEDSTVVGQLLRSSKVALLRVGKLAGGEVLDGHSDGERSVCLDGSKVGGERELGAGHAIYAGNDTNGSGIAAIQEGSVRIALN